MVDNPSAAAGSTGSAESEFQRAREEWAYVVLSDLVGSKAKGLVAPGAVTQTAAFGGRERCRERTDDQRSRQPERELGGVFARLVEVGFDLVGDFGDALLGFGLREPGPRGHQLGDIGAIRRGEIA